MTIDDDLGLTKHLAREGRISLLRAERFTVVFGRVGDGLYRKLCLISFNRGNGSIYAQFTYFDTGPGVAGLVTSTIGPNGEATIDWKESGNTAWKSLE